MKFQHHHQHLLFSPDPFLVLCYTTLKIPIVARKKKTRERFKEPNKNIQNKAESVRREREGARGEQK